MRFYKKRTEISFSEMKMEDEIEKEGNAGHSFHLHLVSSVPTIINDLMKLNHYVLFARIYF